MSYETSLAEARAAGAPRGGPALEVSRPLGPKKDRGATGQTCPPVGQGREGRVVLKLGLVAFSQASLRDSRTLPVLRNRATGDVDPALAGGVVLTTVTDVVGYMAFLGLGAIFLL